MIDSVQYEVVTEQEAFKRAWWTILGISAAASGADIDAAYRARLKATHPDVGGRSENIDIARLKKARAQAHEALKFTRKRAEWDARQQKQA